MDELKFAGYHFKTIIYAQNGVIDDEPDIEMILKLMCDLKLNVVYVPSKDITIPNGFKELISKKICASDQSITNMPKLAIFKDEDEYDGWLERGDVVLHIELRNYADALLIC